MKSTRILLISLLVVFAAPAATYAQAVIQNLEALPDGDSLRIFFDAKCGGAHTRVETYQIDIAEDDVAINGMHLQHYAGPDSIPISVAIVINSSYINSDFYHQMQTVARQLPPQVKHFHIIGTQNTYPDVITYNGDTVQFRTELEARIQYGSTKLFDGLNAAANQLIADDMPIRLMMIVNNGFDIDGDSSASEYFRKMKNYGIDTYMFPIDTPVLSGPFYTFLSYAGFNSPIYTPSWASLATYMLNRIEYMDYWSYPNIVTVKRLGTSDGDVHKAAVTLTMCNDIEARYRYFGSFDDSIAYRRHDVALQVEVPNRLYHQNIILPVQYVDYNFPQYDVEKLLLYVRLNGTQARFAGINSDASTIAGPNNNVTVIDDHEVTFYLRTEGDPTRPNLLNFNINVFGSITPGMKLIEEMKVFSSDGRHVWNVDIQLVNVEGNIGITPDRSLPVCEGDAITLTAEDGYTDYEWSTGKHDQSISVDKPATVWYTAFDSKGVRRFSDTLDVQFHPLPVVHLNLTVDTTVCARNISSEEFVLKPTASFQGYEWSNGYRGRELVVRNSGTYWLRVTDYYGCSSVSDSITVNVIQAPSIKTFVYPGTSVCVGTTVEILANVSGAKSIEWSNGDDGPFTNVTEPGDYFATVVDVYDCVYYSDTIHIEVLPLPEPVLEGIQSACYNSVQRYRVVDSVEGNVYTWTVLGGLVLSGQGGPSIEVLWLDGQDGQVRVDESNAVCAVQATLDVALQPFRIPQVEASAGVDLCNGETTVLQTAEPFRSYQWSNGATTRSITVTTPGTFTVTVDDSTGCSGTSEPVTVRYHAAPPMPVITLEGNTLAVAAAATYQWLLDGVELLDETARLLKPQQNGSYRVRVANAFGCASLSEPFVVDFIAVEDLPQPGDEITFYPTLVDDYLTLNASNGIRSAEVGVFTMLGQLVVTQTISNPGGIARIPVTMLRTGIYIVRVQTARGITTGLIRKK